MGQTVDPLRFRANIYIDGIAPWREFDWLERELMVGEDVVLRVFKRTQRCAATNVDPATGERDLQIPRALHSAFGHADMGIYATVAAGGGIAVGQAVTPPPAE